MSQHDSSLGVVYKHLLPPVTNNLLIPRWFRAFSASRSPGVCWTVLQLFQMFCRCNQQQQLHLLNPRTPKLRRPKRAEVQLVPCKSLKWLNTLIRSRGGTEASLKVSAFTSTPPLKSQQPNSGGQPAVLLASKQHTRAQRIFEYPPTSPRLCARCCRAYMQHTGMGRSHSSKHACASLRIQRVTLNSRAHYKVPKLSGTQLS